MLAPRGRFALVRRLIRLALPIAVGRVAIIGMGVIDLVVVGQWAGDELPDLTLALSLAGPITIGGVGLMLGVQVLAARAVGAGEPALAGRVWRRGIVVAVVAAAAVWMLVASLAEPFYASIGVDADLAHRGAGLARVLVLSLLFQLVFVASTNFLEALEKPVPGAVAMWVGTGVNLVLNLTLVPVWGAAGCAWTTVAARLFLAAATVGYVLAAPSVRPFLVPTSERVRYRALLRVGSAAMIGGLVEAGAFASMGLVAVRISPEAMATFAIATGGLLSLVAMIAAGFGAGAAVLVSQAVGERDAAGARRAGWSAIALNALLMAVLGLLCARAAHLVAAGFTSNAAIAALLAGTMWLTSILFTPDCGQMVVDPALRARGENWFPTAVRLVAFVGIAPGLALWLVEARGHDVSGVFWAILSASTIAYAILLARWAAGTMKDPIGLQTE